MFHDITSAIRPALVMTLLFALLLGIAYAPAHMSPTIRLIPVTHHGIGGG